MIDECVNYWDDMFDEVVEEIKEFEQCDFKKTLEDKKDVEYLTDLKISKDDINEILNHCEKSGLGSAQYFCEEFVFIPDGQEPEDVAKLHDPLYLDISEFNYLNWEGN